jgi:hypothetical protein
MAVQLSALDHNTLSRPLVASHARKIDLICADGQEVVRLMHNAYDGGEPDWGGV